MFGLQILDVAIGLIFIYLVLALACTAAAEAVAGFLDRRTKNMERGLLNLLGEQSRVDSFFEHPLIKALREDGTRPSYIPPPVFATALLDMLAPATKGQVTSTDDLRKRIAATLAPDSDLYRTFLIMLNDAGDDLANLKQQVETWFNNSMDRISAWYKQKTQRMVIGIAFFLTILANADSIDLAQQLYSQPAVRDALVAEARKATPAVVVSEAEKGPQPATLPASIGVNEAVEKLQGLGLKLGWDRYSSCWRSSSRGPKHTCSINWLSKVIGLLITALAVSLGAPFWFDMLNRIISVRGVGKSPMEKAKREGTG